jgi:hypothetical protein
MAGVPEISGPQEREGNVEHNPQRERLHHRGTTAQQARRTHQGRADLKGRLASGGWWLEARWGGGPSL